MINSAIHEADKRQRVSFGWSLVWDAMLAVMHGIERKFEIGAYEPREKSLAPFVRQNEIRNGNGRVK